MHRSKRLQISNTQLASTHHPWTTSVYARARWRRGNCVSKSQAFGPLHIPESDPRGKKKARSVIRIHRWACIARTLKHMWTCIQNASIGRFCGARPARCNPRHVGVGGCTRGCGPETSRCFQTRRHKLPSPPFLTALLPLPHSHRRQRRWRQPEL